MITGMDKPGSIIIALTLVIGVIGLFGLIELRETKATPDKTDLVNSPTSTLPTFFTHAYGFGGTKSHPVINGVRIL
jgi:hypothetical protein